MEPIEVVFLIAAGADSLVVRDRIVRTADPVGFVEIVVGVIAKARSVVGSRTIPRARPISRHVRRHAVPTQLIEMVAGILANARALAVLVAADRALSQALPLQIIENIVEIVANTRSSTVRDTALRTFPIQRLLESLRCTKHKHCINHLPLNKPTRRRTIIIIFLPELDVKCLPC